MNELRERLNLSGRRSFRYYGALFTEANLEPHYWPFRGLVWSFVVHAMIFAALVSITLPSGTRKKRYRDEAMILDLEDLENVVYLPPLSSSTSTKAVKAKSESPARPPALAPAGGRKGLSYPGPQPILSDFPNPTNHMQTLLQPSLSKPFTLEQPLLLPNLVRIAEAIPTLKAPVPPRAETKFKTPDTSTPVAPPTEIPKFDVALAAPAKPLPAPLAQTKFKAPEASTPVPFQTTAPKFDVALTGPTKALAAPLAQPKFKAPDASTPIALQTAVPQFDVALTGPARALPAPLAQPKFKPPDPSMPVAQQTAVPQFDVALTGPAKALPAPLAQPKFKAPDASTPVALSTTAPQVDVALAGPAKPLPAPRAETRIKMPDAADPRPVSLPAAPLEMKLADAVAAPPPPPPPPPVTPAAKPNDPSKNLLALSPMPAQPTKSVAVPAGEARGRFAISPDANLDFPGTEPGTKSGTAAAAASRNPLGGGTASTENGTTGVNTARALDTNAANNNGPSKSSVNSSSGITFGTSNDAFPGVTILGGAIDPPTARNSTGIRNPEPLQTSYGITILASGGSGGGLPDFGVFGNEQVHTVYLDMRRSVPDPAPSWTAEYALPQPPTEDTKVHTDVDVVLPFPISKELPAMPADLVRKYPRRIMIVYGVINTDGKMEQLSVKDTPDRLLNDCVLNALKNWTFRPARRNGEVVAAKALLGIPLWSSE